jgi:hypothetical protein
MTQRAGEQPPAGKTFMDHFLDLCGAGRFAETVVAYVRHHDWVTFTELQQRLEPHMSVRGDVALELTGVPNCFLWAGMSAEFSDLIKGLYERQELFLHPASLLCYMADGGMLRMPVARGLPKDRGRGYAKPRWATVCLRTVPPPGRRGRKRAGSGGMAISEENQGDE